MSRVAVMLGEEIERPDEEFVWLGDLSGWTVELNGWDDINELRHRCGYNVEIPPTAYLANVILMTRSHMDCRSPESGVSRTEEIRRG